MKPAEIISLVFTSAFLLINLAKKGTFTPELKRVFLRVVLVAVGLRSAAAMVGHFTEDEKLTRWFGSTPMGFSSAVCFLLLAICIWTTTNHKKEQ
jgi:hypothetical protein